MWKGLFTAQLSSDIFLHRRSTCYIDYANEKIGSAFPWLSLSLSLSHSKFGFSKTESWYLNLNSNLWGTIRQFIAKNSNWNLGCPMYFEHNCRHLVLILDIIYWWHCINSILHTPFLTELLGYSGEKTNDTYVILCLKMVIFKFPFFLWDCKKLWYVLYRY